MKSLPIVAILLCLITGACSSVSFDSSTSIARPIYESTRINIGGVKQSVMIRGEDQSNPVLIFVHGGPGFSEMPTYPINEALERDFVVVQWDQRGAGKSWNPGIPKRSMTIDQFVADVDEMNDLVRQKLGQEKVLLVGFSFGSLIGLQAVAAHPEKYRGYVGLSHFVTVPESEELLDEEARARALVKARPDILAKLEKIGPPPYKNHPQERRVNALIKQLVIDDTTNPFKAGEYIGKAVWSKYYRPHHFVQLAIGRQFSGKTMEHELYTIDLRNLVTQIDVPMLWISGRQDTTLSQTLAHEYFSDLNAPEGKRWIWLDEVAHPVHLEAPQRFREELRKFSAELR